MFTIVALTITAAAGQNAFRVVYDVDRSNPEQTQVKGTVFNDARQDMLDVSVTAEALDPKGKVLARGIAYVSPRIPGQGSAPFVAKIPPAGAATRFRASVSSFRPGLGATEAP